MTLDEKLGIDREAVARFAATCGRVRPPAEAPARYLAGEEQKRIVAQLRQDEPLILALAINGIQTAAIAQNEGVSAECVLKRLRRYGLMRRGRPRALQ